MNKKYNLNDEYLELNINEDVLQVKDFLNKSQKTGVVLLSLEDPSVLEFMFVHEFLERHKIKTYVYSLNYKNFYNNFGLKIAKIEEDLSAMTLVYFIKNGKDLNPSITSALIGAQRLNIKDVFLINPKNGSIIKFNVKDVKEVINDYSFPKEVLDYLNGLSSDFEDNLGYC